MTIESILDNERKNKIKCELLCVPYKVNGWLENKIINAVSKKLNDSCQRDGFTPYWNRKNTYSKLVKGNNNPTDYIVRQAIININHNYNDAVKEVRDKVESILTYNGDCRAFSKLEMELTITGDSPELWAKLYDVNEDRLSYFGLSYIKIKIVVLHDEYKILDNLCYGYIDISGDATEEPMDYGHRVSCVVLGMDKIDEMLSNDNMVTKLLKDICDGKYLLTGIRAGQGAEIISVDRG